QHVGLAQQDDPANRWILARLALLGPDHGRTDVHRRVQGLQPVRPVVDLSDELRGGGILYDEGRPGNRKLAPGHEASGEQDREGQGRRRKAPCRHHGFPAFFIARYSATFRLCSSSVAANSDLPCGFWPAATKYR